MRRRGRPRSTKEIEQLNFNTFQEDITLFRNGLIDSLEDEDNTDKETISKFLNLEVWKQNVFIVYLITKDKKFTIKSLAALLQIDKLVLLHTIRDIKTQLQN